MRQQQGMAADQLKLRTLNDNPYLLHPLDVLCRCHDLLAYPRAEN